MIPKDQVRTAVDLHAGVGLFALASLKGIESVQAVENDEQAVVDFRVNAEGTETKIRLGDAADFVKDAIVVNERPDLVVLDPPRAGLQDTLVQGLKQLLPPHIIYVSCSPHALTKDLSALLPMGYRLKRMVPVDQFAGTSHLEVVTLLSLES
jgi:tRNA/tmRNA/rRNA uracil-C5-methylase (TrmA/RlmC/RlmD family)